MAMQVMVHRYRWPRQWRWCLCALRCSRAELLRRHQIDVTKGKRPCGLKWRAFASLIHYARGRFYVLWATCIRGLIHKKKKEKKKKESAVYPPCLRAFSPASFLSWLRWTLVQATRWEEDKNGGEVRCYEGLCLFYTLSGWGERTRERQVIVQIIISHYHCVTIVHLVHLHRYR